MIEYLAAGLGILGALLIAFKKRSGFLCWIIGNFLWVILGITTKQWGIVIQFAVFWFISVFGFWNWKGKPL